MKTKNIVHVSEYTKDGEKKKKYQKVGTLFMYDDGGMSIKMEYIPIESNGKFAVYASEPKTKTQSEKRAEEVKELVDGLKQEEIPF